jgi:hypothetical protein
MLAASPVHADGHMADLQARFAMETDPIRRAKLMPDLGQAEFHEINADFSDGKISDSLTLLKQYRDQAKLCATALDAKGIDAEKHSSGFKQLQFSTRESLRVVDELLPGMTEDLQGPFLDVRKDLDELNLHLIHELFPGKEDGHSK